MANKLWNLEMLMVLLLLVCGTQECLGAVSTGNAARKVAIMGLVLAMAILFIGTAAMIWCCMKNFAANRRQEANTPAPQNDTLRAQPFFDGERGVELAPL